MVELGEEIIMRQSFFVDVAYWLIRFFVGPIVRLIWVKKVTGLENIPTKDPVIVAFNHQSYFDFICFIAVSPRNIYYLSAEKFFDKPLWNFLLRVTGQIPVVRKSNDKRETHDIVHLYLDEGKMIGIFPEGTRANDNITMLRAYPGVVRYAIEKKIPVVPVGIIGTFEILPRTKDFPKFKKIVKINVGKPIYFSEYYSAKLDKNELGVLVDKVMLEIAKLSGKIYPYHNA